MSAEAVHRAGVAVGTALALVWIARRLSAIRGERRLRRRLAVLPALGTNRTERRLPVRDAVRRGLPLVGAVCAGWLLVGGVVGAQYGAVLATRIKPDLLRLALALIILLVAGRMALGLAWHPDEVFTIEYL